MCTYDFEMCITVKSHRMFREYRHAPAFSQRYLVTCSCEGSWSTRRADRMISDMSVPLCQDPAPRGGRPVASLEEQWPSYLLSQVTLFLGARYQDAALDQSLPRQKKK